EAEKVIAVQLLAAQRLPREQAYTVPLAFATEAGDMRSGDKSEYLRHLPKQTGSVPLPSADKTVVVIDAMVAFHKILGYQANTYAKLMNAFLHHYVLPEFSIADEVVLVFDRPTL